LQSIPGLIAIDKVVYQRVRREMWLASDNSWVRCCLKHLCWRSQIIILCTLERRMAVSREISRADRCLFGLSSWLSKRSSSATRRTRSTTACLPDNCARLADSLQQTVRPTVDASKFPTLVGQFTQQPSFRPSVGLPTFNCASCVLSPDLSQSTQPRRLCMLSLHVDSTTATHCCTVLPTHYSGGCNLYRTLRTERCCPPDHGYTATGSYHSGFEGPPFFFFFFQYGTDSMLSNIVPRVAGHVTRKPCRLERW